MALRHLLYRCPACGQDPVHGDHDLVTCPACSVRYTRGTGASVRVHGSRLWEGEVHPAVLFQRITEMGGPFPVARRADGAVRYEAAALLRPVVAEEPVRRGGTLVGWSERYGPGVGGRLTATTAAVWFRPSGEETSMEWPLLALDCVQGASGSLQLRSRDSGTVQLQFPDDSPVRWETLLHGLVRDAWHGSGRGEPIEFQPRIRARSARRAADPTARGDLLDRVRSSRGRGRRGAPRSAWYGPLRRLALLAASLRVDLDVDGADHVPTEGPFVLAANHQSLLDAVFVQACCHRTVHTMTKSTQFASPWWRAFLTRMLAFPTRRYRVDPQATRTALSVLAAGRGFCVYPEGERTWDGRLQPFRRGALRLMAGAGVPVVPCAVEGAYDVLPRWSESARAGTVRVRFGPPLRFEPADRPLDEHLDDVAGTLRSALLAIGASDAAHAALAAHSGVGSPPSGTLAAGAGAPESATGSPP